MDASGGALTMNNPELYKRLHSLQDLLGMLPSPFDCFMILRGIRTLSLRMREHMNSAMIIAKSLESNQHIDKVIYPGLKSHEQNDLYTKQMTGFGGLVTLVLKGDLSDAESFINSLNVFIISL
jgi:cystathionine beta-lyase/cystathionine gamma-synthase